MSVGFLLFCNSLFKPVPHPFNDGGDYAGWQFDRGESALLCYAGRYTESDILKNKRVLDVGCGAGGKSLYFAAHGALYVTGVDIVPGYKEKAEEEARKRGLSDRFAFVLADAGALPFEDGSFDSVLMNDFAEHAPDLGKAVAEAMRVLSPGGRLYINFPPYFHPYGAHLSDLIYIPWVHCFFREKTLVRAYEKLASELPDGDARIALRTGNGKDKLTYINKMTLGKFKRFLRESGLSPCFEREIPLRRVLALPAKLPVMKEFFVKMKVCVLEKAERGCLEDESKLEATV